LLPEVLFLPASKPRKVFDSPDPFLSPEFAPMKVFSSLFVLSPELVPKKVLLLPI